MQKLHDLTGQRFGRLTVVERAENKGKPTVWLCKCDCGNEKIVRGSDLKNGHTQSCGCFHKEIVTNVLVSTCNKDKDSHGKSRTRLYSIWRSMKARCLNENHKHFQNYGNRGITICEEWQNNFRAFYDWAMSNGYSDELTLDRKDNDKGYSPENCRWATWHEQRINQRRCKKEL